MIQRLLAFIVIFLCPLGRIWADDWPQWRGPDRSGVSKEKGLLPSWPPGGPRLLWTFREAGLGYSSMAVVGDRLYSMGAEGDKEYVYAIDLTTQKKLWSVEIGPCFVSGNAGGGPRSTPTVDGNFLYAIGGHGDLVCVEMASGRKVWSQGLKTSLGGIMPGYGYCESPLIDGDQVVATPGGKKGTVAFDKKTGALKWNSSASTDIAAPYSSMIAITVGGIRQYVQIANGGRCRLVGVKASDGDLLWNSAGRELMSTPICHIDCVCIPNCCLIKLMPEEAKFKAKLIYANRKMQNPYSGVILVGNYLYGYSDHRGWTCQDFKTGERVWIKDPGMGGGSVISAEGNLYCYHEDYGDVLLLKATPKGYQELGKFRIPEETKLQRRRLGGDSRIYTLPVLANGRLYLRDHDLIFCYDIRKPR